MVCQMTADGAPTDARIQYDNDQDGIDDVLWDTDDDNDGVIDTEDLYPLDEKESADVDGDGLGDNADPDDDNDGVNDRTRCLSANQSRRASGQ